MHAILAKAVHEEARTTTAPDGAAVKTLTIAQIEQLAARHGVSGKDIEIAALENSIIPIRYIRNRNSFGFEDQVRLLKARVAVIGLGGLGGAVVEVLARAGVGSLNLADGDIFEDHNLNRQLLSTHEGLGTAKTKAARDRVRLINTSVDVTIFDYPMTSENAAHMLADAAIAVDCLDSIASRFVLESAARQASIPMVSGAVAGAAGHVTTIFPEDPGLKLIYADPAASGKNAGAEQTLGCLPQTVVMTASVEASETINIILGRMGKLLRNKMLAIDLDANLFEVLNLM